MFCSGLDLGQLSDFTALVTVERNDAGVLGVRRAHRWDLGTTYTAIIDDLNTMYSKAPLHDSPLVIDATGVGLAVVEMIVGAGIPASIEPWSITAGKEANRDKRTVPKIDLVAAIQAGLCGDTLKIAEGLKHGPTLKKELETFRSKVTADRNETFSAWRENDHDDLVLALALAVWFAQQWSDPKWIDEANRENYGRYPTDDLPPGTFRNID